MLSQNQSAQLPIITFNDVPVITTEFLARAFESETVRLRQNYNKNKSRFTIGKHFFKLNGDDLREFKRRVALSDSVNIAQNVNTLLLWTERGAARHAKMLETNQAWDVFEKLEDYYFNRLAKSDVSVQTRQSTATAEQLTPLRQTAERLITTGVANIYPDIWKLVHQRFDVQHINQLLPEQVSEAIDYLDAIEREFISKQAALAAPKLNLNFPMSWWHQYRKIFEARGLDHVDLDKPWNFPAKLLYGDASDSPSAISELLFELEKAGFNVQAARFELQAHRHHLEMKEQKLENLAKLTRDYATQAQRYLGRH